MRKLFVLTMLASIVLSCGAYSYKMPSKIISSGCIMSYTDALSRVTKVIHSSPIVINLRH